MREAGATPEASTEILINKDQLATRERWPGRVGWQREVRSTCEAAFYIQKRVGDSVLLSFAI